MTIDQFPADGAAADKEHTSPGVALILIFFVGLLLFVAVCNSAGSHSGRAADPEELSRVTMDMSKQEVLQLLGPPHDRRSGSPEGISGGASRGIETYIWKAHDGGVLELEFTSSGKIAGMAKRGTVAIR